MITIKGRNMIIPPEERTVAVLGDQMSAYRIFVIDRYVPEGADLSALSFRLDIRYSPTEKNSALLVKTVMETKIELRWDIIQNDLPYTGTMFIQIRANDEQGTVKWRSAEAAVYCEQGISSEGGFTGDLSELETLEAKVSEVVDSENGRIQAEKERETNEKARQEAETQRETAETERVNAEKERAEEYEKIVKECEAAADSANNSVLTAETTEIAAGHNVQIKNKLGVVSSFEVKNGAKGDKGDTGPQGETGPKGDKGDAGEAATIKVGNVTTGEAGSEAVITNVGTENAAVFDFVIPKGDKGETGQTGQTGPQGERGPQGEQGPQGDTGPQGPQGQQGEAGKTPVKGVDYFTKADKQELIDEIVIESTEAPTIEVGSTTTGEAGTEASVTNSGTATKAVFNFVIPRGDKGETGAHGTAGADGEAATIEVGSVTTGEAGSQASVTNGGTENAAILNFVIPKGEKGDKGETGEQGPQGVKGDKGETGAQGPAGADGEAATIEVGSVTTGEAGSQASVTNSGTENAAILNFVIPKGEKGDKGETGEQGQAGNDGKSAYQAATEAGYVGDEEIFNEALSDVPNLLNEAKEYTDSVVSNRNLLINWDFANPVNQRGQTTYTASGTYSYTIDRWRVRGQTQITVLGNNGGITYGNNPSSTGYAILEQIIDNMSDIEGKALTMSIIIDGQLVTMAIDSGWTFPADSYIGLKSIYHELMSVSIQAYANKQIGVYIYIGGFAAANTNYTLSKIKLELGSVSTLLNDPPQNPNEELIKCLPYGERFGKGVWGKANSTSSIYLAYKYSIPKRVAPTVSQIISGNLNFNSLGEGGSVVLIPEQLSYTNTDEYGSMSCRINGTISGETNFTDDVTYVLGESYLFADSEIYP